MRSVFIGLVVALVVGFLMGLASAAAGISDSWTPAMVGASAGIFAGYISNNLAGTRKSAAVPDALRAEWLAMTVPDTRAALYVMRSGFVAKLAGMDIVVDGTSLAQIQSPEFTRIDLAPGPHEIAVSLVGGAGAQSKPARLSVECAAGRATMLHTTLAMGALKNQLQLRRVDGEEARRLLQGAKAVAPSGAA